MKKIDATVLKETRYILLWVLLLSALMEAVFLIVGSCTSFFSWDYTVLLGNLLGGAAGVLNFLLMGITVQRALTKDEKEAKTAMKLSILYRFLLLVAVALVGALVPCFNIFAVLIPLFFPRIAIAFRPLFDKKKDKNS